jgi:uncharacterized membrane protein YeaQ/YmgE (transglycosylase-associated protein family)
MSVAEIVCLIFSLISALNAGAHIEKDGEKGFFLCLFLMVVGLVGAFYE